MRREAGDSPHRGPGCTTGHPRVLPRQDDRACVWPWALRVTLLLRFSAAALGVATPHGALASDAGGRCANVSEAPGGAGGTVITAAQGPRVASAAEAGLVHLHVIRRTWRPRLSPGRTFGLWVAPKHVSTTGGSRGATARGSPLRV